jgi:hypothetical protein
MDGRRVRREEFWKELSAELVNGSVLGKVSKFLGQLSEYNFF